MEHTNEIAERVFWELHSDLPREGPGNFEATQKAFDRLKTLPEKPHLLDVGCGPGMQTLDLAKLTQGTIVAADNHQPYLDRLQAKIDRGGLGDRVRVVRADMADLPFAARSFDAIWSEGAIYIIGFDRGLHAWQSLLKPGGYLAVTELTWLHPHPPQAARDFWRLAYPAIRDVNANVAAIAAAGYEIVDSFALPEAAWWNDYYDPLERKIARLEEVYGDRLEALQAIESERQEIDLYRNYSKYYGYVFYIAEVDVKRAASIGDETKAR